MPVQWMLRPSAGALVLSPAFVCVCVCVSQAMAAELGLQIAKGMQDVVQERGQRHCGSLTTGWHFLHIRSVGSKAVDEIVHVSHANRNTWIAALRKMH